MIIKQLVFCLKCLVNCRALCVHYFHLCVLCRSRFVNGRSNSRFIHEYPVIGRALCVHYFLLCVLCCALTAVVGLCSGCGVLGGGAARPEGSQGLQRPRTSGPSSCIILRVRCSQKSQKFIWACRLVIVEAVPRCTMKKLLSAPPIYGFPVFFLSPRSQEPPHKILIRLEQSSL